MGNHVPKMDAYGLFLEGPCVENPDSFIDIPGVPRTGGVNSPSGWVSLSAVVDRPFTGDVVSGAGNRTWFKGSGKYTCA